MRLSVTAMVSIACISLAIAQQSSAAIKMPTNIPPQLLGKALQTLASERDFQVVYVYDELKDFRTAGAVGQFTQDEALLELLHGTGLRFRYLDPRTVTIEGTSTRSTEQPQARSTEPQATRDGEGDRRDFFWERFRVAQVDPANADSAGVLNQSASGSEVPSAVEEVVVTAQKRAERLQDVPVPVTVLNADKLAGNSQLLLRDYYNTVPSFNLVTNFGFTQNINIRGVTTGGFSNPTVGITVDDVPYGSSINNGGGNQVPDIDPSDLAQIEVLRGPQGTLYGANSMGGLVKYVTKAPSLDSSSGRIEAGVSSVAHGDEPGYQVRASGNIPVSDTFAMRVSAYSRKDPGYIDNPVLGREDVNDAQSYSARVATLWKPTDRFSAKLTALYQRTDLNGLSQADVPTSGFPLTAGLSDLEQSYMPGVGGSDRKVQAYSATLEANLGFAGLTSITGYNVNEFLNSFDRSANWSANTMRDFGVTGLACFDTNTIRKFTQEVRLSSAHGQHFDWEAGAFYTEENTASQQHFMAADQVTGQIVGLEWFRYDPIELREYAAFASLTWKPSERFDVQFGGRESQIKQDEGPFAQDGGFVGGVPILAAPTRSDANAFTYLVTPRLKLSQDLMMYVRLASGYRPGGPNFPTADAPSQYQPDRTENYEIGLKGDFLDHALSIDASLYYIDWKNLQISLRNAQASTYFTNGSRARSQGVEVSVTSRPITGLTLNAWVVYSDAELSERFPGSGTPASPVYGESGDRLPNTPRYSGHVSIEQDFPLGSRATGFIGGAFTYTGDRVGVFQGISGTGAPLPRQDFPSYTRTDLRAGVRYGTWMGNLFVNNLTDERGLIGGGIAYQPVFARIYIPPRTVGFSLAKEF
jgi:outer membrane receptor protein involved in Fe transport